MGSDTLQTTDQATADTLRWYHTIDLPGGVTTRGEYDLRGIVDDLPWPSSLAGKRCLDVGSRDGFYAFHMEKLGAEAVVSLDIDRPDQLSFPGSRPADEDVLADLDAGHSAFRAAGDALASQVERSFVGIYDATRENLGSFDFAIVATLLLHLRDPERALASIRALNDGPLLINEAVIPGRAAFSRRPAKELIDFPGPFWSVPNPAGLERMARQAGYRVAKRSRMYLVPNGKGARPASVREAALTRPWRDAARRLIRRRGMLHTWLLCEPV